MGILYTIGYTLSALFASHVILSITGAIVLLCFSWWSLKRWHSEAKIYKRNAAYVRKQQKRIEEWHNYFEQQQNRKHA
ncbi:hypothetical protein DFP93_1232 [Aneurinibacillus soli]|uniref:Uncharacterized protein n=1 Tax=Aneurinibacillus soli TaxID=1500254 RepID=A0A0U5B0D7_9BACL|nr:hypothetical protein [Aneurinibacillus soli]PYE58458.1 hypothetical protein DFP93_1232 [Aneurinibacillus soli]BAU29434.1 hypothetical protein CB4_03634 [Aneurinibacillus soli]